MLDRFKELESLFWVKGDVSMVLLSSLSLSLDSLNLINDMENRLLLRLSPSLSSKSMDLGFGLDLGRLLVGVCDVSDREEFLLDLGLRSDSNDPME